MKYNLTLKHLYPKNLNLYGDKGNVIALKRRAEWHGIDLELIELNIGTKHKPSQTDIYFMGGGQDSDQVAVVKDFHELKAQAVKEDTENNVVFLGVCGGYQLMGKSFLMGNGESMQGLGIIGVETKAPGVEVKERCIGNLVAELDELSYQNIRKIYSEIKIELPRTLVGFENHSGQTFITESDVTPLAKTKFGFGNNASKTTEGARYKNVFGCYMHGSFLPKNPHFADYMLWLAIINKYKNPEFTFKQLDDSVEYQAHKTIVEKY